VAQAVKWTEIATDDLDEVAQFIARDSVFYARVVVREARTAARSLPRFARRGRVVPESARPDIREIFVRDYRLIYHIAESRISIVAFIHGARDLAALWEHRDGPRDEGD
jgi:plasmid stabilization system protein ParE